MAKNTFLEWSTTAGSNTDVGGVGILGTNAVDNFDDALRTIMAQLRRDIDGKTVVATKTTNYTAVANDNGAVHRFTSAATVSLTAAATLAANWHYTVVADGADVTIDPNGSETINGNTTYLLQSGSSGLIVCNGSAFFLVIDAGVKRENHILNGLMDINSSGGGAVTATGYTNIDQWYLSNGTGASNSVNQVATTTYPEWVSNTLAWTRSVAGSSASQVRQPMESAKRLAGKRATVYFRSAANANTEMDVYIEQFFGTGGSPSASVFTSVVSVNLTGAKGAFTATFDIPSISGKTFGSNSDDALRLYFRRLHTATNPTALVEITDVMLVEGDATAQAEPALRRTADEEIAACQRFLERSHSTAGDVAVFSGSVTSGQNYYAQKQFKVQKRAVPSVALTSAVATGFPTTTTANGISVGGFSEQRTANATTTGGVYITSWVADARLA